MDFFNDHAVLALLCSGVAVGFAYFTMAAAAAGRQRADAGDRPRCPGGRRGVPTPPVHDDRGRRPRAVPRDRPLRRARLGDGDRLRDRRRAVGRGGLHRHERRRPLERPPPRQPSVCGRPQRRLPRRLGHGPARRRPRPARRRRLLRVPHEHPRQQPGVGDRRPDRPGVRRFADLGLRPASASTT